VFDVYKKLYGSDMEDSVEGETTGNLENLLLAVGKDLRRIRGPDSTDPGSRLDGSGVQTRRIRGPDSTDPRSDSTDPRSDSTDPGSRLDGSGVQTRLIRGPDSTDPGSDLSKTLNVNYITCHLAHAFIQTYAFIHLYTVDTATGSNSGVKCLAQGHIDWGGD